MAITTSLGQLRPGAPVAGSTMKAKGSFFIGRKNYVCGTYGEARWNDIVAKLAKLDPVFGSHILTTSLLPAETYVLFQETLVRELFHGDEHGYWVMGEKAGEWALTDGPYQVFRGAGPTQLSRLVGNLPRIWEAYFTSGRLTSELQDGVVHVKLHDLPLQHVSLELSVMGFGNKALEMCVGRPVRGERVVGISAGHGNVHYRFYV